VRVLLVALVLFSITRANLIKNFENKNYKEICTYKNVLKYTKDEKALSLIGISCVKSDRLFILPAVVKRLKKTSIGQRNAVYFSTIYLQKKLLIAYFFDNYILEGFSFPRSDYFISVIFDSIKNQTYEKDGDAYIVDNGDVVYKVFKDYDKLVIDEIRNGRVVKTHWFR